MPYAISYRRWTSGRCRLKVNGFDMPKTWSILAKKAMQVWTTAGARFQFVEDPGSPSSILCEELGDNGWIGITTLRPVDNDSNISQVLIRLNTRHAFTPAHPTSPPATPSKPYDLYTVLLHELGHALHLGEDYGVHSDTVMRPTLKPGEVRGLANDDIHGIKLLYP